MGAPEFLHELRHEGFTVLVEGGDLYVGPSDRLTEAQREEIRRLKRGLLELAPHRHWRVTLRDRIVSFTVPQGITRAEVLQHYPTALDAQPMLSN